MEENWKKNLATDSYGNPVRSISNLRLIFTLDESFSQIRYDTFCQDDVCFCPLFRNVNGNKIDEESAGKIQDYLERTYRIRLTQNKVFEILKTTSSERSFNPVQEFITQETWDGQPRIATTIIDYLGAEDNPLVTDTPECDRKPFHEMKDYVILGCGVQIIRLQFQKLVAPCLQLVEHVAGYNSLLAHHPQKPAHINGPETPLLPSVLPKTDPQCRRADTGDSPVFKQLAPFKYVTYVHGTDVQMAAVVSGNPYVPVPKRNVPILSHNHFLLSFCCQIYVYSQARPACGPFCAPEIGRASCRERV